MYPRACVEISKHMQKSLRCQVTLICFGHYGSYEIQNKLKKQQHKASTYTYRVYIDNKSANNFLIHDYTLPVHIHVVTRVCMKLYHLSHTCPSTVSMQPKIQGHQGWNACEHVCVCSKNRTVCGSSQCWTTLSSPLHINQTCGHLATWQMFVRYSLFFWLCFGLHQKYLAINC